MGREPESPRSLASQVSTLRARLWPAGRVTGTLTFLEEGLCQHHADEERQSQDHHCCLAAHDEDAAAAVAAAALVVSQSAGLGSAPVLLVRLQESECWLRVWWREAQWQELC